jgi:hypothetical protein
LSWLASSCFCICVRTLLLLTKMRSSPAYSTKKRIESGPFRHICCGWGRPVQTSGRSGLDRVKVGSWAIYHGPCLSVWRVRSGFFELDRVFWLWVGFFRVWSGFRSKITARTLPVNYYGSKIMAYTHPLHWSGQIGFLSGESGQGWSGWVTHDHLVGVSTCFD